MAGTPPGAGGRGRHHPGLEWNPGMCLLSQMVKDAAEVFIGAGAKTEVGRSEGAVWGQGAEMRVLLRARGQGDRGRSHSPGPQAL